MGTWYIRRDFKSPVDLSWQIIWLHRLLQKLQICMCKMGNCICQRPSSHTSSCVFCRCHLHFEVGFSYFTLSLSDLFSCPTNLKNKNTYINFSKLPIIEDVCLRFPSAPSQVILQKQYTNDMAVCNTSPASSGKNLMQLLYNQIGDWSV